MTSRRPTLTEQNVRDIQRIYDDYGLCSSCIKKILELDHVSIRSVYDAARRNTYKNLSESKEGD